MQGILISISIQFVVFVVAGRQCDIEHNNANEMLSPMSDDHTEHLDGGFNSRCWH